VGCFFEKNVFFSTLMLIFTLTSCTYRLTVLRAKGLLY